MQQFLDRWTETLPSVTVCGSRGRQKAELCSENLLLSYFLDEKIFVLKFSLYDLRAKLLLNLQFLRLLAQMLDFISPSNLDHGSHFS